jgi:hypothetical protein
MVQHVLPKGLRRSRNYGFLHPNSKRMISLLKLLVFTPAPPTEPTTRAPWLCACCGACMRVLRRRLRDTDDFMAPAMTTHLNSGDG